MREAELRQEEKPEDWLVQGWEQKVEHLMMCMRSLIQKMEGHYMAWQVLRRQDDTPAPVLENRRLHLNQMLIEQGLLLQSIVQEVQGLDADALSYMPEEMKAWKVFIEQHMG